MACARRRSVLGLVALLVLCTGCSRESVEERALGETLVSYPSDDLAGLRAASAVELDRDVTSDGGGSFRVSVSEPTTVALYETGDIDVENAMLVYRAKLRSAELEGEAYLEMWCSFGDAGEFFSRGLDSTISGSADWSSCQTPFALQVGQNPDNVRLNLVVNGRGTVWVDDIELMRAPLR